ncbi:MAG: LEA type 2 family protein [Gemmatimonas sp.]|uniref:LEA type 2 family protein n=1 Tax=Gemmatimonas sp. TaxID=1962908 RepID=UPI00391F6803|nr:LEA type 2 family protein [Gemmatimonadota bacterium]
MTVPVRRCVLAACVTVAATFAVGGCAALGRATFTEPDVRLREFVVTGLGLTGGSVDLVLSVYNPNGYHLDAVKMTYRVDVDSIKLGEGELADRFVVQEKDSSLVRLPVRFTYAGLGAAGRALITSGTVNYRVRGDFTVATPLGSFTRPYDRTGRYSSVTGNR